MVENCNIYWPTLCDPIRVRDGRTDEKIIFTAEGDDGVCVTDGRFVFANV